jgi:uncharacterized protein
MPLKALAGMLVKLICSAGLLIASGAWAAAQTKIDWTDLQPRLPPLLDPLAKLTDDQRFDFETIMYVRGLSAEERKNPYNVQALEDAARFEKSFKKAKIDIDKLGEAVKSWQDEIKRRGDLVNSEIDGKRVRIAGYLLPLDFADDGVQDFLLVPYVGACIHVPPPPPNQIIYVRASEKFQVKELFVPAWITGTLKAARQSKNLSLVDGDADIPLGYAIEDGSIEEYSK